MKYRTLLLLLCLLSSTKNWVFGFNLFDEEDDTLCELVVDETDQSLFQQAYMNARHMLQKPKDPNLGKQNEQEVLPQLWQSYKPQILNYKKLTDLVNFFIEFQQTSQDLNESTSHSINFCGEDLCSAAPCCACDYEYDPDPPVADGPCNKGFCNCMWIGPTSIASGFLFMFRTLSSFLWCGPCGVYVSLGLGTCAGAAGGTCLACVPTCIKAVRKKLKEKRFQDKVIDLTPVKERIRLQFASVGQCSIPDQAKLKADVQFLQQDPVMSIILNFYKPQEIPSIESSYQRAEDES